MRVTRSLGAVLVASCVLLQPLAASAQAVQRAVYASVLNDAGEPVEGLNAAAFVVREDGVAREVLRVVPADEPMQIALLVDNSTAASQMITSLRQALTSFITAMTEPTDSGAMNQIAIVTLASRPTIAADYTTNRQALLDAANRIFPETNAAAYLLDAIVEIGQGMARQNATRPVIVAITTEGRDYSTRQRQQALSALDRAGGVFESIIIGPSANDLSDEGRDRAIVLGQGPEAHGGRRTILLTAMSLPAQLEKLATQLRSQYKVIYSRPEQLIPPETITVSAADPDLKAYGVPALEPDARSRR